MIVNLLITAIVALVGGAFSLLPESTIGYLDTSRYSGITATIGDAISRWDSITHSVLMVEVAGIVLGIMLPGILLYKVLNWIWKHIPNFGGFGPGAG